MSRANPSSGAAILATWRRLAPWPGGRWFFSRGIGRMVPYSGSIGARIEELRPGSCRLRLRDRPRLRNHLASVHAVALTNAGELASGLAMLTALPPGTRGIVVRLETEFLKKARGTLVVESNAQAPAVTETVEHRVRAEIRDGAGDLVARVTATWRLDPSARTDSPVPGRELSAERSATG